MAPGDDTCIALLIRRPDGTETLDYEQRIPEAWERWRSETDAGNTVEATEIDPRSGRVIRCVHLDKVRVTVTRTMRIRRP